MDKLDLAIFIAVGGGIIAIIGIVVEWCEKWGKK